MLSLFFSVFVYSQAMDAPAADNTVPDVEYSVVAAESPVVATDNPVVTAFEHPPEAAFSENPLNPFDGIFATFFALAAFIPVAFQFIRKLLFPGAFGLGVQIFSWVIGILITMAGWALNLGFLDGLSVWMALLYGAGASLAANGVYDTGLINAIFNVLFKLLGIDK